MRYGDPIKALGMCLKESQRYCGANLGWHLVRVTGMNYPGREHWASVQLQHFGVDDDAAVRDGTMRQFSATAPIVWEGGFDDWVDDMCEFLNDHLLVEVYLFPLGEDPFYVEHRVREDIEPGPMERVFDTHCKH